MIGRSENRKGVGESFSTFLYNTKREIQNYDQDIWSPSERNKVFQTLVKSNINIFNLFLRETINYLKSFFDANSMKKTQKHD